MVNIIAEGWKEVKVVSISAVTHAIDEESSEIGVNLTHHSYRAGLWDAATFTNHHWAEACRRGLEKRKRLSALVMVPSGPRRHPGHGLPLFQYPD